MTLQVPMLDAAAVTAALPMSECIEAMERALCAYARGDVVQPARGVIQLPDGAGSLYTMPAFIASPRALTVKLITIFHGNAAVGRATHQGLVVVFDPEDGRPALLIDAERLTAIRTAAVSAVATRALAREDASELAILGTGVQARGHLAGMRAVRPIRRVRIWGRTPQRATRLAAEARADGRLEVVLAPTAAAAARGAHIICTTTSARTPVLEGAALDDGVHINAIGASMQDARELDSDAVARARIFVDSRSAAADEAGDLLIPFREGRIAGPPSWTELGAVLTGVAAGRTDPAEITLFKSVGLAFEDAAAAALVASKATSATR